MPTSALKDQFRGYRHPFLFGVHYLGGVGDNPRTLVELAMTQFSTELRSIPGWWKRMQQQAARAQWTESAVGRSWSIRIPSGWATVTLSPKQISYVLDELAGYAALRDDANQCQVSCFERIWESHSILDQSTKAKLHNELDVLRKYHSGRVKDGDGVSTTVIDPFRHCLVYNRTLVSYQHRQPRSLPAPPSDIYTVSSKFSLLPTDVSISPAGTVKFLSYVNDLHPQAHASLYNTLETTLARLIPLFEHTLTDLHRNNPLSQKIPGACRYTVWEEPDPPEYSDDEDGWTNYEREMRQWVMSRPLLLPDVPATGYPGGLEFRKHIVSLRGRNLQVIVKASDVRLQPGGPNFPGTPWHVVGMRNERIVACGMYFVSADNITDRQIQFRMAVTYPRGFSAGDGGATLRTWGLQDGDPCHQYVGSTKITAGLGVVFPNIYQHSLTPFQLVDPAREGHLQILSFYVVDPDVLPILSTSAVAPQQEQWTRQALSAAAGHILPVELVDRIVSEVEGLMNETDAEAYREEFLTLRDNFRVANDNYHFCIPFDIWNGPE